MAALYSVGTWCRVSQGFTPQAGLSVPSINIPLKTLRVVLRELRAMGYNAGRWRLRDGEYDSDPMVLVERTDGKPLKQLLIEWER